MQMHTICMHECIYECMYVCMYLCMYLYMYIYIYLYRHRERESEDISPYICSGVCYIVCVYMYIYTPTCFYEFYSMAGTYSESCFYCQEILQLALWPTGDPCSRTLRWRISMVIWRGGLVCFFMCKGINEPLYIYTPNHKQFPIGVFC